MAIATPARTETRPMVGGDEERGDAGVKGGLRQAVLSERQSVGVSRVCVCKVLESESSNL